LLFGIEHAIAATLEQACGRTAVIVDVVTVVALFSRGSIELAVAAACECAIRIALRRTELWIRGIARLMVVGHTIATELDDTC